MDILQSVSSSIASTNSVTYGCVLTNKWSGATHPFDYARVSDSAHWSKPVLASHNSSYEMWAPQSFASQGVENVAETGSTETLESELMAEMNSGTVANFTVGINQFNNRSPPQLFNDEIFLSEEFPLLSTISMAAPSPDWFTGIYNFSPINEEKFWYESFEIATFPFDAGTEMGSTYSIGNQPEDPVIEIFQLTNDTIPANGILLDPTGVEVLPVAVWNCVLKSPSSPATGSMLGSTNVLEPPSSPATGSMLGSTNVPETPSFPATGSMLGSTNVLEPPSSPATESMLLKPPSSPATGSMLGSTNVPEPPSSPATESMLGSTNVPESPSSPATGSMLGSTNVLEPPSSPATESMLLKPPSSPATESMLLKPPSSPATESMQGSKKKKTKSDGGRRSSLRGLRN
jgi:hypothetical protein